MGLRSQLGCGACSCEFNDVDHDDPTASKPNIRPIVRDIIVCDGCGKEEPMTRSASKLDGSAYGPLDWLCVAITGPGHFDRYFCTAECLTTNLTADHPAGAEAADGYAMGLRIARGDWVPA